MARDEDLGCAYHDCLLSEAERSKTRSEACFFLVSKYDNLEWTAASVCANQWPREITTTTLNGPAYLLLARYTRLLLPLLAAAYEHWRRRTLAPLGLLTCLPQAEQILPWGPR
jgi:hypothetical protein